MISYSGGRDDFAALLDESVNASKSQITGSVKKKLDTSGIEVSDLLIKAMINSNVFNNTISNGVYDTISANTGIFNNLIAKTINVQQLMANSGLFETIDAGDGNIRSVLAVEVNASRMSVGTLVTDRLILRGKNSIMYELNNFGDITETKIPEGDLDKYYLNGKHLQVNTLSADRIISHSINSEQITTDNIRGTNGWINLANGTFLFFNGISNGTGKQTDSDLKPINEKEWSAAISGISWDGKQLSIKGNIVANSLTLGSNVNIGIDNISGLEKYATVKSLGDYAKTSDVTNDISAAEGRMQDYSQNSVKNYTNSDDFKKFYLHVDGSVGTQAQDDHGKYASGFFNVSKDGLLVAENAVIYGKLFSSEGLIAGWNITNDALSKNLGYNIANSADKHNAYFGTSGLSISNTFVVDSNGNFTFGGKNGISYNGSKISLGSDVSITWGQVTGTGNIATTSQIPTKVSDLDNDANYKSGQQVEEAITSKGYKTESEIQTIINGKGFYTSTDVVNYIKSDEFKEITNPQVTKITKDTIESATISANQINGGTITGVAINGVNFTGCKGDFTGEVVASKLTANTAGSIAGWTITNDALYKNLGYNQENTNDKHNAYFGKDGLSISNTFVVSADGSLTATKGRISGWNLTQGGLWYNDATDYRVYLLNGTDDSKNVIVIGDKTKNITDPNYYTFWLHANGNMSANRVNVQENLYVNQYFYYSKDAYSQTSTGAVNTRLCDLNENGNSRLARVSSSSKRYKTILSNISNKDVEKMFDIPTYWFKYKSDYIMKTDERYNKAIPGFIVEDWENIMPIAIDHIDGKPEMWNNNIVVPLMFEMLKTVKKENNDLKQRIKMLESKLA